MSLKEIPCTSGLPILGHLLDYKKDRLKMLKDAHKKLGPIFKIKVGPKTLVVATAPEHVEHILQKKWDVYIKKTNADQIFGNSIGTANGEEWKRQRALIQPLLNPRYFSEIFSDVKELTKKNIDKFYQESNDAKDLRALFSKTTYDIILKCMIGLEAYDRFEIIDSSIKEMTSFITSDKYSFIKLPEFLDGAKKRFNQSLENIDNIIFEGIEHAKNNETRSLVQVLLKEVEQNTEIKDKNQFIRDNIFTLIYAGYDTSAFTLSWLSYELSQNPDWISKCLDEIKDLNFDNLEFSDIKDLPILEACIFEAMRMYPPGWAFTRFASQDDNLCGYKIQQNDILLYSAFLTHRDEKLWQAPEVYNPQRFIDKPPREHGRFKFIPFGAGPRTCTGMNFAMMEIKVILIYLLKNYDIKLAGDKPIMDARVILFSKNKFQLKLQKR
jgi:cytochrome P450